MSGAYVLIVSLDSPKVIEVGSLGKLAFSTGYYTYTGSAMGGVWPRLRRHMACTKKLHWHIDFLLKHASLENILLFPLLDKLECEVNAAIMMRLRPISPVVRFGSSDCRCLTHLFHFVDNPLGMLRGLPSLGDAGLNIA